MTKKKPKLKEKEKRMTHEIIVIESLSHLIKNQAEISANIVRKLQKIENKIDKINILKGGNNESL